MPGPLSASGEASNGQPVQVELFIDGAWIDITSLVMVRDGSDRITITRGQRDEAGRTEQSTCRLTLNNRDGRFSPRNPTSPYYGKLGRNTPLRVSVPGPTGGKMYRFWGEVSEWPQRWDITGTDVWVEAEATGILRRLAQGAAPARSVMYRAITDPMLDSLLAYWPLEDIDGSLSMTSALTSGSVMEISGTPDLAAFARFPTSDPLPVMTASSFGGGIAKYSTFSQLQVRFLLFVPAEGLPDAQAICRLTMNSITLSYFDLTYEALTGGVRLRPLDFDEALLAGGVDEFGDIRGKLLRVSIELADTSPGVACTVRLVDLERGTTTVGTGSLALSSLSRLRYITMASASLGHAEGLTDSVVGHVTAQSTITSITDIGVRGNPVGEKAGRRIQRTCAEEGVALDWIGDLDDTVAMGGQPKKKPLDLIQECVEADLGILYENLAVFGLGYRPRTSLYNQDAVLTLSYSANQLSASLDPVDDDQFTHNDITVTRDGGGTTHTSLTIGPMGTADPPAGIGTYGDQVGLNIDSDATLDDQASWRLHMGTVDEARYPQISVNLAHNTFTAAPALKAAVLDLRQGDRIVITDPPTWLPPDNISLIILGSSETIDHFEHRITLNCAPASPYEIGILNSAAHARLDTAGSALAAAVDSTATNVSVTTTTGPVWTTDSAEMPFDVQVGGEAMTVTAISGASSPQTFTVTRSVNGVVKSHSAGADLRLATPTTIAL
ncbi:hypothetical protein [Streptomyces sp. AV19]|uniref:hypothetical protein n=1 Tax=Streptomyces sp. AV19 TaxID=2793068 RepID=UPI002413B475|nr:hypothetical protein [Streptomyces sp. AV19]MDG4531601.1 hypothetical protein [Streptomyces sp. AV19]